MGNAILLIIGGRTMGRSGLHPGCNLSSHSVIHTEHLHSAYIVQHSAAICAS